MGFLFQTKVLMVALLLGLGGLALTAVGMVGVADWQSGLGPRTSQSTEGGYRLASDGRYLLYGGSEKSLVQDLATGRTWPVDQPPDWDLLQFAPGLIGNGLTVGHQGILNLATGKTSPWPASWTGFFPQAIAGAWVLGANASTHELLRSHLPDGPLETLPAQWQDALPPSSEILAASEQTLVVQQRLNGTRDARIWVVHDGHAQLLQGPGNAPLPSWPPIGLGQVVAFDHQVVVALADSSGASVHGLAVGDALKEQWNVSLGDKASIFGGLRANSRYWAASYTIANGADLLAPSAGFTLGRMDGEVVAEHLTPPSFGNLAAPATVPTDDGAAFLDGTGDLVIAHPGGPPPLTAYLVIPGALVIAAAVALPWLAPRWLSRQASQGTRCPRCGQKFLLQLSFCSFCGWRN